MPTYVLGTHDAELQRLGFQAQVWRARALALFERAGFGQGQRLLDVGCGPGYVTLDLARIATSSGEVLAVDASERYIEHCRPSPGRPSSLASRPGWGMPSGSSWMRPAWTGLSSAG